MKQILDLFRSNKVEKKTILIDKFLHLMVSHIKGWTRTSSGKLEEGFELLKRGFQLKSTGMVNLRSGQI